MKDSGPDVISRNDARAKGLKRFYTGAPCAHGHLVERWVSSGGCMVCAGQKNRKYYAGDPERYRAHSKNWRKRNTEKLSVYNKNYKAENFERFREKCRQAACDHYHANREEICRLFREKRAADPGKYRERTRLWIAANPERSKALKRKYYAADPEKHRRRSRKWQRDNPEKFRMMRRLRRQRKRAAEGRFTEADVRAIMGAQKGRCAYCKQDIRRSFNIDHITPLAKGGTNWPKNLQLTCETCNKRKHAKDPEEFARELGLLL